MGNSDGGNVVVGGLGGLDEDQVNVTNMRYLTRLISDMSRYNINYICCSIITIVSYSSSNSNFKFGYKLLYRTKIFFDVFSIG